MVICNRSKIYTHQRARSSRRVVRIDRAWDRACERSCDRLFEKKASNGQCCTDCISDAGSSVRAENCREAENPPPQRPDSGSSQEGIHVGTRSVSIFWASRYGLGAQEELGESSLIIVDSHLEEAPSLRVHNAFAGGRYGGVKTSEIGGRKVYFAA